MEVKVSLKIKLLDVPHVLNEDREIVVQPVPPQNPAVAPQRQRVSGEIWPATMAAPYIAPRLVWLSEMDAADLSDLCDVYRAELFKRAGKGDPEIRRPREAPRVNEYYEFFQNVANTLEVGASLREPDYVLTQLKVRAILPPDFFEEVARLLGLDSPYPSHSVVAKLLAYLTDRNAKAAE